MRGRGKGNALARGQSAFVGCVLQRRSREKRCLEKNERFSCRNGSCGALYECGKSIEKALAICTVSDSLITGEALPAEEREQSFTQMIELALDVAAKQGN